MDKTILADAAADSKLCVCLSIAGQNGGKTCWRRDQPVATINLPLTPSQAYSSPGKILQLTWLHYLLHLEDDSIACLRTKRVLC